MSWLVHRMVGALIRYRGPLCVLAAVSAALAYVPASRLALDRSIDTMFAPQDPLLPPYKQLQRTFGGNDVVLCVYDDPALLAPDRSGMERVAGVGERLSRVAGVGGILSLDLPIGPRVVDPDNRVASEIRHLFEGYTHGADGRTVCVACMLTPPADTAVPRERTVDGLRAVMRTLPEGRVTGEPVMLVDAFRFVEADGHRLATATTLLLGCVMLLLFRSWRWVVAAILVVQWALLLTKGLLAVSGTQLTMVSSMLTAVVTVIGVATVVHVIIRFREAQGLGYSPLRSAHRTARLLARPIFWACITDAVGFGALLAADVAPVRDFGLMMALGALMVLLGTALIVPAVALLGARRRVPAPIWGDNTLERQLRRLVHLAQQHPRWVAASLLAAIVFALLGVQRLEVETDFTRNFRSDTTIVKSYELVESKLGGAGVCDVMLRAPAVLNWNYLRGVLALEDRLRSEVVVRSAPEESRPGLTKVISLADAVQAASPVDLGAQPPRRQKLLLRTALAVMRTRIPKFYDALYGQDPQHEGAAYFRIMLRALERQPAADKLEIIRQVEAICQESAAELQPQVTGYFVLLTNLIHGLLRDQWRTFGLALLGIALTMRLALGHWKLALIALVPNTVPILVVNGAMGWLQLPINMGAAMIAAVSVGLSVDSSIHYLTAYRRRLQQGDTIFMSLSAVQQSVGRALVFATVALVLGFSVLATSRFVPTVYFGVLVSLAMLGGLLGNLLWLPMLVRLWDRRMVRSTHSRRGICQAAAANSGGPSQ